MRFALSDEQRQFALGAHPVDLVVACEELGHHPLPGPVAESVAAVPQLLAALLTGARARDWLAALASGDLIATLARPPLLPCALDADAAGLALLADAGSVWSALPGARLESADRARRLFAVTPDQALATGPDAVTAVSRAIDHGTLASAALLLGAGRGLLEASTRHARTREQFGRPVGAFQAVKHALADVLIGLEFARPMLYAAAIALGGNAPTTARDISAARVACADAARRAARAALQVHGAIGYTLECDISLWLAKVRSLSSTWGSQAEHRAVVLAALVQDRAGAWS
ncbi:MAG TPA: acyl-CoA dehydrogenase family protein [Streptosporangiaceae bacterium]|nr:acyl-CoA dehydrogenase family protein [Streptosporangiaceae bacterium]